MILTLQTVGKCSLEMPGLSASRIYSDSVAQLVGKDKTA